MKKAIITGIHGQDGSYLAELLLSKGYDVYGMERRSSGTRINTRHLIGKITFVKADLSDQGSLLRLIEDIRPDEVYNLGAQSFVGESWNTPEHTANITGLGAMRVLEAIRAVDKRIKFYQAGSSEMFGKQRVDVANEKTEFYPRSPYGVAKLYAHWITKNYRESYGMFCCNGILFNHESERRGYDFVTRKITDGVARIRLGLADFIELGNIDSYRDFGYAPDYVEAMYSMLQASEPDDYVIATGEAYKVRDFLDMAFACIGVSNWGKYVKFDSKLLRPAEVEYLKGDSTRANNILGWRPSTNIKDWACMMVENDIRLLSDLK